MWRRSGRIEDRARARVDSKAGEAEGRRCGARGDHLLVQAGRPLTCSSCPCKVEVDQRWIPERRLAHAARIEVGGPRRVHEPTNQEQC